MIFTDSGKLNSFIKNGKTKIVSFPGATSKKNLHYLDVHRTNSPADAFILHVGVNDLLEDNGQSKIQNLGKNRKSMVVTCHTFEYMNVFVSGLVYTTRIGLSVLERAHEMIVHLCNKLGICSIDNKNKKEKFVVRWFTSRQIW